MRFHWLARFCEVKNEFIFLLRGQTHRSAPTGLSSVCLTVCRGFLFRVLDVFALGRSAVLSVLVAGLLVVTILGLVGTD